MRQELSILFISLEAKNKKIKKERENKKQDSTAKEERETTLLGGFPPTPISAPWLLIPTFDLIVFQHFFSPCFLLIHVPFQNSKACLSL